MFLLVGPWCPSGIIWDPHFEPHACNPMYIFIIFCCQAESGVLRLDAEICWCLIFLSRAQFTERPWKSQLFQKWTQPNLRFPSNISILWIESQCKLHYKSTQFSLKIGSWRSWKGFELSERNEFLERGESEPPTWSVGSAGIWSALKVSCSQSSEMPKTETRLRQDWDKIDESYRVISSHDTSASPRKRLGGLLRGEQGEYSLYSSWFRDVEWIRLSDWHKWLAGPAVAELIVSLPIAHIDIRQCSSLMLIPLVQVKAGWAGGKKVHVIPVVNVEAPRQRAKEPSDTFYCCEFDGFFSYLLTISYILLATILRSECIWYHVMWRNNSTAFDLFTLHRIVQVQPSMAQVLI